MLRLTVAKFDDSFTKRVHCLNKRGLVKRGLVDEATAFAKFPALAKIHSEGDSEPEYEADYKRARTY